MHESEHHGGPAHWIPKHVEVFGAEQRGALRVVERTREGLREQIPRRLHVSDAHAFFGAGGVGGRTR